MNTTNNKNKNNNDETEPLLPPHSEDDKKNTESSLLKVDDIVETIMKASRDISLRYISRDELVKIISKLHNHQQDAFLSNDFIVLKTKNSIITSKV